MSRRVAMLALLVAGCDRVFGLDRPEPIDAPVVPPIDAARVVCSLEVVPVQLSVGSELAGIAAGELTGDAHVDLVLVSAQGDTISLIPGNGDGTFAFMTPRSTMGTGTKVAVVMDADDDSMLDFVTSNSGSNDLTVFLRRPPGFQIAKEPAFSAPTQVAVGKLDGSSRLDLAVTNVGNGTITIHLAESPEAFANYTTLMAPGTPQVVAIADVNGDQNGDVISGSADGTARIFLGDGNGAFPQTVDLPPIGANPSAVVAARFGDGATIDLAFVGTGTDQIAVFTNDDNGTMSGPVQYPVGSDPVGMIAVDITQDGLIDLVTANRGAATLTILEGAMDGSFGTGSEAPAGSTPSGLVSADFNHDERPDLAVTNGAAGTVTVLLNRCVL